VYCPGVELVGGQVLASGLCDKQFLARIGRSGYWWGKHANAGLKFMLKFPSGSSCRFPIASIKLFYCCHSSVLKTHKIVFGLRDSDGSLSTHILFLGRLSLSMIRHQYLAYHFPTSSNTKSVALSLNKNVLTAGNAPGHLGNALASTTRNP
jgi:hypothetical protein